MDPLSAHARHHYWLLGLLVAVAFAPGRTNAATVLPVSGARFDAELLAVSAAGQVTFQTAEARRTMPLADLVRWGTLAEPQHGAQIVLNGGGLVVVDAVRIEMSNCISNPNCSASARFRSNSWPASSFSRRATSKRVTGSRSASWTVRRVAIGCCWKMATSYQGPWRRSMIRR